MKTFLFLFAFFFIGFVLDLRAQTNNNTGFFMWDEATSSSVIEDAIARGMNSFRSRDLTILYTQAAWNVFKKHSNQLDVMVAIPVYYTYTTTPVDLNALADSINKNPFIRRLQVYPKLQPGLMNPSELNPCNDWLTGYANEFEQRIRQLDQLVTDKSVEILVAGQLGTPGCSDLTQIVNTLYDLQSTGRNVGWGVTVYPYYYGTQDPSLATLTGDVNQVLSNLSLLAPTGKQRLPLRVIESGWPSECSTKATLVNHCTFAKSAFDFSLPDVKLYYFELQDFSNGWSECEKYFGLYDVSGNLKCPSVLPVTWEFINSKVIDGSVVISWSTESERDNKIFVVERSEDGLTFHSIGSINGLTHSSMLTDYQFTDPSSIVGRSYYRIKQIDNSESFSYSPIVTVNNLSSEIVNRSICNIYPNPISCHTPVTIDLGEDAIIEIYNDQGKLILIEQLTKGNHHLPTFHKVLEEGLYHFVISNDTKIQSISIAVVKDL